MTPAAFCYWLRGIFEVAPEQVTFTPFQVSVIKQHLDRVFAPPEPTRQEWPAGGHDRTLLC